MCRLRTCLLMITAISILVSGCKKQPPYKDKNLGVDQRVEDLLERMTLDEKIEQLAGLPDSSGMKTVYNRRLGIPDFKMCDGPVGVRWDTSTAFPSGVSLAATFDTSLARRYGEMIAKETLFKGRNYLLAPCINIHRLPTGGRNFESYGEDPFLAGKIASAYIKAVQKEGVITSVKHYALNNQEWERTQLDVIADERTMREIYLPAFEMAVKEGGAYTVMASYNKINGWYASENEHLLQDILKNEWGFKGLVISDWGATHSTSNAIRDGLDLEMPTGEYLNRDKIMHAIQKGEITKADIDNMVRRILWVKFQSGLFDRPQNLSYPDPSEASAELAYDVAVRSIVLLKNSNHILPVDLTKIKSIAVIGPNASVARTGGGGSSHVVPWRAIDPLTQLKNVAGNQVEINYAQGVKLSASPLQAIPSEFLRTKDGKHGINGEYFKGTQLEGSPTFQRLDSNVDFVWEENEPVPSLGKDHFSVRWTGYLLAPESRNYVLYTASDDGIRLYVNNKLMIDNWTDHGTTIDSAQIFLKAGEKYEIKLEFFENAGSAICQLGWDYFGAEGEEAERIVEAVRVAKESDIAIVFAGSSEYIESEGYDRIGGMKLTSGQDELIEAVVKANPKTIVVLYGGTSIDMSKWGEKVPAILDVFFPGQEGSRAIIDILLGKANPSGKLPFSFIQSQHQSPAYKGYKDPSKIAHYSEGIYVGYRYYEKNRIQPAFPFGFGLSYTEFEYTNMQVEPLSKDSCLVSIDIKNIGQMTGTEIVQIYVVPPDASNRPLKELKGFAAVTLRPGENQNVRIILNPRSFSYYDQTQGKWVIQSGKYTILASSSSVDTRQQAFFEIMP
ncbi:MAG TPA: glycoside hydrolase family 3 C-terminal domain-containing protein [Bacteroidales bacterium]|nr:glycoside hydrolase family 3 C-terminal domain-containing protein [Bacteroidales bacterium]